MLELLKHKDYKCLTSCLNRNVVFFQSSDTANTYGNQYFLLLLNHVEKNNVSWFMRWTNVNFCIVLLNVEFFLVWLQLKRPSVTRKQLPLIQWVKSYVLCLKDRMKVFILRNPTFCTYFITSQRNSPYVSRVISAQARRLFTLTTH